MLLHSLFDSSHQAVILFLFSKPPLKMFCLNRQETDGPALKSRILALNGERLQVQERRFFSGPVLPPAVCQTVYTGGEASPGRRDQREKGPSCAATSIICCNSFNGPDGESTAPISQRKERFSASLPNSESESSTAGSEARFLSSP